MLRGLLASVGVVDAVLLRVLDEGALAALRDVPRGDAAAFGAWLAGYAGDYMLVDGHLRVEELQQHDGHIEALVLDLDSREAAEVLAVFDPIGDLAEMDKALFAENAALFEPSSPAIAELMADLQAAEDAARQMAEDAEREIEEAEAAATGGDAPEDSDAGDETAIDPTDEILAKWEALGCVDGSLWEIPSADGTRVHRVLCGDSRKPESVERLMAGCRAKLGQHDPPYGVKIVERGLGSGRREGNSAVPRGKFRPVVGDGETPEAAPLLDSGDRVVLWGANNFPASLPPSNHWIVWDKKTAASGEPCADNAFGDAELAFVTGPLADGRVRIIRHLWAGMYRASEHGEKRLAPTQKPVAVIAKPIEWWTAPGDLVTDWYCGSGTTGIAAEKLGRVAYLMEITPRYVAVTLERFSRLGLTPRLAARGIDA